MAAIMYPGGSPNFNERDQVGGDITVPSNPTPTTPGGGGGAQITQGTGATLDPSQSTLSPNFAPYVYDMLRSAQTAASRPFMPYMGQRFAGASPLEQQGFQGISNLQTPWQFGAGSGMAYQAGLGSFTQPGTSEAFMSPYMRGVTDIAKREARRQSDIGALGDRAAFAKAGAFGGSRQAIVEAERQRNLAQQMGDIEERGLQSAYDRAAQQYNAERQAQLQAAMGLGSLGQQQFGTQYQGIQGLLGAGATQRGLAQQPLDFGYQQWQESLQYPYKQATFLSSMLAGMPVGAAPYRPATEGDSGFGSALQGGLSGLALYNLFNQK